MADDRDPKRRARSIMGDTERAEIGREHRQRTSTPAMGVPIVRDPDEVTSPVELLLRELTEEEKQYSREIDTRLADRSPQSPATVEELLKVAAALANVKKQERRDRRESANQTLQVAAAKGPPLERLEGLERKMRVVWALLAAAGTAAAGSIITVGKGLYERGADEGAQKVRFDHQERDLERMQVEVRELRERLDRRARTDYPLPNVTPKGTPP